LAGSNDDEDKDVNEEVDTTEEQISRIAKEKGFHTSDLHGPFSSIAQQMINESLDVWGFVVFKTWGYGKDVETWTRFWAK
jgi:hypothetical protein